MRASELRKLPKTELEAHLRARRVRLAELREQLTQKRLKNVGEVRAVKKEIARILTLLHETNAKRLKTKVGR